MADANRGRGRGRRGRGRGRGFDPEDEAPANHHRDQRDLEIAAMGRRIRELERQIAEARLGSTNGDEEEEEETTFSEFSTVGDEDEEINPWGTPNHGRNPRRRPESDQTLGMKIDLPEFDGKSHPDEFIDWLHTVKQVFDVKTLTDEQKVKFVALKLRKHASIWSDVR